MQVPRKVNLSATRSELILATVEGIVAAKAQKATEAMLVRTETRRRKQEQIQSKTKHSCRSSGEEKRWNSPDKQDEQHRVTNSKMKGGYCGPDPPFLSSSQIVLLYILPKQHQYDNKSKKEVQLKRI